jgi:hypothetical protein
MFFIPPISFIAFKVTVIDQTVSHELKWTHDSTVQKGSTPTAGRVCMLAENVMHMKEILN